MSSSATLPQQGRHAPARAGKHRAFAAFEVINKIATNSNIRDVVTEIHGIRGIATTGRCARAAAPSTSVRRPRAALERDLTFSWKGGWNGVGAADSPCEAATVAAGTSLKATVVAAGSSVEAASRLAVAVTLVSAAALRTKFASVPPDVDGFAAIASADRASTPTMANYVRALHRNPSCWNHTGPDPIRGYKPVYPLRKAR